MYLAQTQRWTMERVIRAMAGIFTLAGVTLVVFSLTGFCPMAVVLERAGVPER